MQPRGPFHIVFEDSLVRVWLGQPNDPESECVLVIDKSYLPALIAALKAAEDL